MHFPEGAFPKNSFPLIIPASRSLPVSFSIVKSIITNFFKSEFFIDVGKFVAQGILLNRRIL